MHFLFSMFVSFFIVISTSRPPSEFSWDYGINSTQITQIIILCVDIMVDGPRISYKIVLSDLMCSFIVNILVLVLGKWNSNFWISKAVFARWSVRIACISIHFRDFLRLILHKPSMSDEIKWSGANERIVYSKLASDHMKIFYYFFIISGRIFRLFYLVLLVVDFHFSWKQQTNRKSRANETRHRLLECTLTHECMCTTQTWKFIF